MARPEKRLITFEIDGREVRAPEGTMLVDAARMGDVEIPYFCYEPKLGQPVGACRMCLVQIEGMPKLQTACSTPVKEGMVVTTVSPEVKQAQNAVVEFLLANHPLDCPVCDKGGECPLQDISYGWGPGASRFTEPKRHFKKPIELSPLIAIDRERCILCYRCVRFSQEVSEDHQLVFLERGDRTFVGTADGAPYVAPFSGNIIELCPVGALTSIPYRFRARPWDVEQGGTVCTLCPSQCNVSLTIRDDRRVLRVLARDNAGVDDGWLCDRGRFGYQAFHSRERITRPLVREGTSLVETSWERALAAATQILARAGASAAALVGGSASNEEGFLVQRLIREVLGSGSVDSRPAEAPDAELLRACADPALAAAVSDIDHADAIVVVGCEPVDEMASLDLRIRKAVRRNGAKLVTLTPTPSRLDSLARVALRYLPGATADALAALNAALGQAGRAGAGTLREATDRAGLVRGVHPGPPLDVRFDGAAARPLDPPAGAHPDGGEDAAAALASAAALLAEARDVVVIVGERGLVAGGRERAARSALLALLERLGVRERESAGLIEVPFGANGRGLREVGCLPGIGPGLADAPAGKAWSELPAALASGEVGGLLLYDCDPLTGASDRAAWERALAARSAATIAFARFRTETVERFAQVVFPAEVYAEKDGTVTHPDGRLQRLRQVIARADDVRPGFLALVQLAARLGARFDDLFASSQVTELVAGAVPFYAGLDAGRIGGKGVRWQETEAAASAPRAAAGSAAPGDAAAATAAPSGDASGRLLVARQPALWACEETVRAPVLRFLRARQRLALAPADAQRLGVRSGERVRVASAGGELVCEASVRTAVPAGRAFLIEGLGADGAEALLGAEAAQPCVVERVEGVA